MFFAVEPAPCPAPRKLYSDERMAGVSTSRDAFTGDLLLSGHGEEQRLAEAELAGAGEQLILTTVCCMAARDAIRQGFVR